MRYIPVSAAIRSFNMQIVYLKEEGTMGLFLIGFLVAVVEICILSDRISESALMAVGTVTWMMFTLSGALLGLKSYDIWKDTPVFTHETVIYEPDEASGEQLFNAVVDGSYIRVRYFYENSFMDESFAIKDVNVYVSDTPYLEIVTPKLSKWYYWFFASPWKVSNTVYNLYLPQAEYQELIDDLLLTEDYGRL